MMVLKTFVAQVHFCSDSFTAGLAPLQGEARSGIEAHRVVASHGTSPHGPISHWSSLRVEMRPSWHACRAGSGTLDLRGSNKVLRKA